MRLVSTLRKQKLFVLAIVVFALAFVLWVGYEMAAPRWPWVFYWSEARQANKVIAAVDSFQSRYGRLPNTLADIGLEASESGPVHYQKTSDSIYIVWFGTVLGESATYESATKERH
jgi:hypothetical protein